MKVLVTTPNGKVGSELVRLLQAQGLTPRLGAHTPEKAAKAFPGAEVVHLDFFDAGSREAAVQGIDALYLAAPGDMAAEPQNALIDAAKAAGAQRMVKLSAMGAEMGDSPLRQVELHAEQSGLAWTHLRPNWFMQNFSTGSAAAIRGGVLAEPAADAKTSFIDARDIAAVAAVVLTGDGHAGQAYPLTGPHALDRHEVAAAIAQATGKPVQYVALSDEQFREGAKAYMSSDFIETMSFLFDMVRAGYSAPVLDTVPRLLGRPAISFAQFAQDHREAWL